MLKWWRRQRASRLSTQASNSAANGNTQRAIQEATAAILLDPLAETYQLRGQIYRLSDLLDKAILDYTSAISLSPDDANLYRERGQIKADLGQHDSALIDFEQAIRLAPSDANAYFARAKSHVAQDNVDGALEDLDQAINLNPNAAIYRMRGELRMIQGNTKGALEDYDQALDTIRSGFERTSQILAAYADSKDVAVTAQNVSTALRTELVDLLVQRGTARQVKGELPLALKDINEALGLDSENAAAYDARGKILYQQDDTDAIDDFKRAIDLDPHRYSAYLNLAEAYFKLNQHQKAFDHFQHLDDLEPNNVMAQVGLALCNHAMGKRKQAKDRWRLLIATDDKFADIKWLKSGVFVSHPLLFREAGNLVVRM